ncbi:MAG: PorV/PorQ family protein, partial [Elusimicrobia bacterium]|nr:PorV/PorQ family protein [Elusimicrobiota bacterium]
MRRPVLAALAAVLCAGVPARASFFPSSPFSDAAAGTTGAAFLKIPAGARLLALGGSAAASSRGADALFWNPAGAARLAGGGRSEASFSYNALLASSYGGAAAYARPLSGGDSVVGGAFVYHSAGTLQGYDRLGNSDGSLTAYDLAAEAAYARRVDTMGFGAAAKLIRSDVAGASGTSFAVDLGVTADRVSDIGDGPVDLGAAVQNLGPAIQVGGVASPLPFQLLVGSCWHMNPQLDFMLDGHLPADAAPYPS